MLRQANCKIVAFRNRSLWNIKFDRNAEICYTYGYTWSNDYRRKNPFGGVVLKIQESAENYLETILVLSQNQPHVRSIDIANELGFSKPSVSVAMKNLRNSGHIQVDPDGHITLTESGKHIAEMIYERHTAFSSWLISLGVSRETAIEDACRLEHVISAESFAAIKNHINQSK